MHNRILEHRALLYHVQSVCIQIEVTVSVHIHVWNRVDAGCKLHDDSHVPPRAFAGFAVLALGFVYQDDVAVVEMHSSQLLV